MALNKDLYDIYLTCWLRTASGGRITHTLRRNVSDAREWVILRCTTCGAYRSFDMPFDRYAIDGGMMTFVTTHKSANSVEHHVATQTGLTELQKWKFSYTSYPLSPISDADLKPIEPAPVPMPVPRVAQVKQGRRFR